MVSDDINIHITLLPDCKNDVCQEATEQECAHHGIHQGMRGNKIWIQLKYAFL